MKRIDAVGGPNTKASLEVEVDGQRQSYPLKLDRLTDLDLLSLADSLAEAARKHDEAMVREFGEPKPPRDETDFTWLELRAKAAAYDAARRGTR